MPRKVLIYGGSGGVGQAIGRRLAARGDSLHLVGRNPDKLNRVAQELGASLTVGDVSDESLFERVSSDFEGPWEGLVYAVGSLRLAGLSRLSGEDFRKDFMVNAAGAALAVRAGLRALKRCPGKASVVLFSSVAAEQGFSLHASIAMAKGAVSGLTRALAAELAPKIRVNAIAPSLTQTPLADGILVNDSIAQAIADKHPLRRLGAPEDLAAMTEFLLASEADWITGQIIGVDGGRASISN